MTSAGSRLDDLTDNEADWSGLAVVVTGLAVSGFAAADALLQRGARVTVVDGREPHAVLLELFTSEGVGTQVLPGVETKTRKARDAQ